MMRKKYIIIIILLILINVMSACSTQIPPEFTGDNIKVLVLYSEGSDGYKDISESLEQSIVANLQVESRDINKSQLNLSDYDIIYPDSSIIGSSSEGFKNALKNYVKDGGSLFLDNEFYSFFDKKFIGAKEFVKLEQAPMNMSFPEVDHNSKELQEIIKDFSQLYKEYNNYIELSKLDYGYGLIPDTASVLAKENETALYTINKVEQGYVFFTNPLLPNVFSANGFNLKKTKEDQAYFSNTTASANQIIRNKFAAYISKEKRGYAVERIFGSFGTPSISWQLHLEDIEGIKNKSSILFDKLCKKYQQIPSYMIVRNPYKWFLKSESITYLLNETQSNNFKYNMYQYENAYSSGKHVVARDKWLSLDSIEEGGSYFIEPLEHDKRAYPYLYDFDGDGFMDIISGSADGYFYYFKGLKQGKNYTVDKGKKLKDKLNNPIKVSSHSAPILIDIDGDGLKDILSGSGDGNIYWFKGKGDFTFEPKKILIETSLLENQSTPSVGDLNNDGIPDLIVGSKEGKLLYYIGEIIDEKLNFKANGYIQTLEGPLDLGKWIAPNIVDLDGDGKLDLAIGTFDGYIMKYMNDGEKFEEAGFFEGDDINYKGNKRLKFGNNCVPQFFDINNDGKLDLVVGQLEYGLAVPIDSPYFKYKDSLFEQIDYINKNKLYLGAHVYTHEFASKEYEKKEIEMHKKAFENYGVLWEDIGVNQHTWFTNKENETQTYVNQRNSGLLWNSGSQPSNSTAVPQISTENVLSMPFYMDKTRNHEFMLINASTLLHKDDKYSKLATKYNIPLEIYYHADFAYQDIDKEEDIIKKVSRFVDENEYNFVREDQLIKGAAAAYNSVVDVKKDKNHLTLKSKGKNDKLSLYDERYQNSTGVRVSFSHKYDINNISTDADVWHKDKDSIYISLNKETHIYDNRKIDKIDIKRINIPAEINYSKKGVEIKFLDDGMQQVEVYGEVNTKSKDWEKLSKSGNTIFTKYGKSSLLKINK